MARIEQIYFEIDKRKYHADCPFDYEDGFKRGVKWADTHPNPNTIKKIFEFALEKTNFLISDNLESIDWKVLIKKAMEE